MQKDGILLYIIGQQTYRFQFPGRSFACDVHYFLRPVGILDSTLREDQPGQQIIIANPSAVRPWSASSYLANSIEGMETKSGR